MAKHFKAVANDLQQRQMNGAQNKELFPAMREDELAQIQKPRQSFEANFGHCTMQLNFQHAEIEAVFIRYPLNSTMKIIIYTRFCECIPNCVRAQSSQTNSSICKTCRLARRGSAMKIDCPTSATSIGSWWDILNSATTLMCSNRSLEHLAPITSINVLICLISSPSSWLIALPNTPSVGMYRMVTSLFSKFATKLLSWSEVHLSCSSS
jgi:hypothetical protein